MTIDDSNSEFQQATGWLRAADKVVVFTGAGMSAASGIATFRDEGGFWQRFPPEEFANWKGLIQTAVLQPKRFAEFLIAILEPIANAAPNKAHRAIAKLEQFKPVEVITQNIDRLHHEAGSNRVHEIHGNLFEIVKFPSNDSIEVLTRENLLEIVQKVEEARANSWTGPKLLKAVNPLLGGSFQGMHRPNLVLFGDQLAEPDWTDATHAVHSCDLVISVGTSQSVYPAASLPSDAHDHGAKVIVVDPESGGGDLWFAEKSETFLPHLLAEAFGEEEKGLNSE